MAFGCLTLRWPFCCVRACSVIVMLRCVLLLVSLATASAANNTIQINYRSAFWWRSSTSECYLPSISRPVARLVAVDVTQSPYCELDGEPHDVIAVTFNAPVIPYEDPYIRIVSRCCTEPGSSAFGWITQPADCVAAQPDDEPNERRTLWFFGKSFDFRAGDGFLERTPVGVQIDSMFLVVDGELDVSEGSEAICGPTNQYRRRGNVYVPSSREWYGSHSMDAVHM